MVNIKPKDMKVAMKPINLEEGGPMPDDGAGPTLESATINDTGAARAIREISLKFSWLAFCCDMLRQLWMGLEFGITLYFLFALSDGSLSSTICWTESSLNIGLMSLAFCFLGFTLHQLITSRWLYFNLKHFPYTTFFVIDMLDFVFYVVLVLRLSLASIPLETVLMDQLTAQPHALVLRIISQNLPILLLSINFLQTIPNSKKYPRLCSFVFCLLSFVMAVSLILFIYYQVVILLPVEKEHLSRPFVHIPSRFFHWMYVVTPIISLFSFSKMDPMFHALRTFNVFNTPLN